MIENIWLIGAGPMAVDYHKVLSDLRVPFTVVGRGESSAKIFSERTGVRPFIGGLDNFLTTNPEKCTHAIVAVGVETLAYTTSLLLEYGIPNILVEKPAGLNKKEIRFVTKLPKEKNAKVYVAYNRRFYASVLKAKEIIEADGGVKSFNFEFTEWAHEIEPLKKAEGVKENWFLTNSTHVVDLAFHLGGKPKKISSFVSGGLDWHPTGSIFSGAGVCETGALFSYQANWESAGRWSVEILTKDHRFIFRPMEKLQIQEKGSVKINFNIDIDYSLDKKFKPGLYKMVQSFLNQDSSKLCTIEEQCENFDIYFKMANYSL